MRIPRLAWLFLVLLAAGVVALVWVRDARPRGTPIRVAYAGPVSGPSAEDGLSAVRAVELVFDQVNRAGGVAGRPLTLDVYDDANDPEQARRNAATIAGEPNTIAVIGHNLSTCSLAAGEVYAAQGIPAITNAATSVGVTQGNPWYFRTVFNDRDQGRYIVAYLAEVLEADRFGIVHEPERYGAYLAEVMRDQAPQSGVAVAGTWSFDPADERLGERLDAIARETTGPGGPPALVLAVQPVVGVQLVARLRDRGYRGALVVTDALASQAFADGFEEFPRERRNPGVYTDGIYASTPFLFDAGGPRAATFMLDYLARYDRSPDWYAAFAADAAVVVVEALRRTGLSPSPDRVSRDRSALRDGLASIGSLQPAPGISGPVQFDATGDAHRPVPMGRFLAGEIISAFVQLRVLPGDATRPEDLDPTLDPARVVRLGDRMLYRTDVARAGARARRFGDLDFSRGIFELDFDLWFRHRGDRGVENVEFTNAVAPISLGEPLEEVADGPVHYRLYRLSGEFRADTIEAGYGEHALALSLHHRDRTRDDLVFAIDSVGMGLGRARARADRGAASRELLGATSDWRVRDLIFFESEVDEPALGNPSYLAGGNRARRFSQLTMGIRVRRKGLDVGGFLPERIQYVLLAIAVAGSLALLFMGRLGSPRIRWFLQAALAPVVLVVAEPVLGNWLLGAGRRYEAAQLDRVFQVLWWVVPAVLLNVAIGRFVWAPAEERSGHPVPTVLRYFVAFLVFVLAGFGVVAFVYDYRLTGLLATSGVLAMILGLAVQLNITNIFAGVALNLERPFRVGDWIMIHGRTPDPEGGVIGMVVDINWRTTRLRTADDTEIVIPNGVISEKTITNFMLPHEMSRFELLFAVDQSVPPETVIPVILRGLELACKTPTGPLADPPPSARIHRTSENGIEYMVRYRIVPRDVSPQKARHTVNECVIRELRAAGIELAYPRRRIREERPQESA